MKKNLLWYAPNALTQIPQAESFDATVRLELQGKEDGDQIVFGMLGHKYTYLALQKAGEEYFVVLNEGNVTEITGKGKAEEKVLMKLPWKCNTLWIRIKMQKNAVYTYEYSEDGKNYTVLGDQRIFEAQACTWTGMKLVLAAQNAENKKSTGWADIDFIHFE